MPLHITELFGFAPSDRSLAAQSERDMLACPFVGGKCTKQFRDGAPSGVCSVRQSAIEPIICCPKRLYSNEYQILLDVAEAAFCQGVRLINGEKQIKPHFDGLDVAVFGHGWGKELRLPSRGNSGSYFVDWILARLDANLNLAEFVALEVQSIDTTGSYRAEQEAIMDRLNPQPSKAGLNWENVSKRILPQLIYKGNLLQQEPLCSKGLFFVCPIQVFERIMVRLGGNLPPYPPQHGSLTFRWYQLGPIVADGNIRNLEFAGQLGTLIHQVSQRFILPDLPPPGVYEVAIRKGLEGLTSKWTS